MAEAPNSNPVKTQHEQYRAHASQWKRCRDAAKGQDAIHAAGAAYLPRLEGQSNDEYNAYKIRAEFFNATWRTVSGLSGMMFRKPYRIEVPDAVLPLLEDVTMSGTPLSIFVLKLAENALVVGRLGILVDHPSAQAGLTVADAQRMNLRPTMSLYETEAIINWRTASVNNKKVPVLVVLEEEAEVPARNEFERTCETQWRVLDLVNGVYRQRLFRLDEKGVQQQIGGDVIPLMNGRPMDAIPFFFIGVDDTDPDVDCPPLIDLVDLNLAHYRTTADYEHGCHFTGLPQPYVSGVTKGDSDPPLTIGSSKAWILPDPAAKAGYLSLDSGFAALEKNLERKEHQMAILGARMLEEQPRAVETAEVARLHSAGEASMLASMANALSRGIERALRVFCDWAQATGDVSFQINRDFVPAHMSPQELTALVTAWQQGAFSRETLFSNLQRGEIISDEQTFEEELSLIDEEQARTVKKMLDESVQQAQALADVEASRQQQQQSSGNIVP